MTIYIGIDWSSTKHDVTMLNEQGGVIQRLVIEHSVTGFQAFAAACQQVGATPDTCVIGIETAHSTLLDYLWTAGYEQIYVLAPGAVVANRGRNRLTGARDDRFDAFVIADTLRTDLHRHTPWTPGGATLQQLRVLVNRSQFLTGEITRLANRLHAVLTRYYPAALAVFKSWPTPLNCHFVLAYPTPAAAAALTWPEFQAFAKQHHYPKPTALRACFARLQADYPVARPPLVLAYQTEAQQLANLLLATFACAHNNAQQLQNLFATHPDAHIFASLPGAGAWLAPALLVKVGEDRRRFPTAAAVQAMAGTCPVTEQSGKQHHVRFRRGCDHSFRNIVQQWARCAAAQSPWAATYFDDVLARGGSSNHAYRCLANRLLAILWKLWQTETDYDEAYHLRNRAARCRPLH